LLLSEVERSIVDRLLSKVKRSGPGAWRNGWRQDSEETRKRQEADAGADTG
jgi:hypothetical protein